MLFRWIKDFLWCMVNSYSFMQGSRDKRFWKRLIPVSIQHANFMRIWHRMTPQQREQWYLLENRCFEMRW